jgi:hypothetical protein
LKGNRTYIGFHPSQAAALFLPFLTFPFLNFAARAGPLSSQSAEFSGSGGGGNGMSLGKGEFHVHVEQCNAIIKL